MKPSGTPDQWSGKVYNASDGKTYSGSFTMTGPNTAELKGCVMSIICKIADLDAGQLTTALYRARWPNSTARTFGSLVTTADAASMRIAKARFTAGRARIVSNQRLRCWKFARS